MYTVIASIIERFSINRAPRMSDRFEAAKAALDTFSRKFNRNLERA